MRRMQQKGNLAKVPKPCDYFHLIGGTSTGGYDLEFLNSWPFGVLSLTDAGSTDIRAYAVSSPSCLAGYK